MGSLPHRETCHIRFAAALLSRLPNLGHSWFGLDELADNITKNVGISTG